MRGGINSKDRRTKRHRQYDYEDDEDEDEDENEDEDEDEDENEDEDEDEDENENEDEDERQRNTKNGDEDSGVLGHVKRHYGKYLTGLGLVGAYMMYDPSAYDTLTGFLSKGLSSSTPTASSIKTPPTTPIPTTEKIAAAVQQVTDAHDTAAAAAAAATDKQKDAAREQQEAQNAQFLADQADEKAKQADQRLAVAKEANPRAQKTNQQPQKRRQQHITILPNVTDANADVTDNDQTSTLETVIGSDDFVGHGTDAVGSGLASTPELVTLTEDTADSGKGIDTGGSGLASESTHDLAALEQEAADAAAIAEQLRKKADQEKAEAIAAKKAAEKAGADAETAKNNADAQTSETTANVTKTQIQADQSIKDIVTQEYDTWTIWASVFYSLNESLKTAHYYSYFSNPISFTGTNGAVTTVYWKWIEPKSTQLVISTFNIPQFTVYNIDAFKQDNPFKFTVTDLLDWKDDKLLQLVSTGFFPVKTKPYTPLPAPLTYAAHTNIEPTDTALDDIYWLRNNKPEVAELTKINNWQNCKPCSYQFPTELVKNALYEPGTIVQQLLKLKQGVF